MATIVPMQLPIIQHATLTILGRICDHFAGRPNPNVLFFLKGGMAYEILRQGATFPLTIDPSAGNDFDTILLINPELEPAEFNAILVELREVIYDKSVKIMSEESLRSQVLAELDDRGIPVGEIPPGNQHKETHPFVIRKNDDYWAGGFIPMNLSLISIFLNTHLIPEKPGYYTKLIDISIPFRHYNLLQFDYALYSIPGRINPITIDRQAILIADFLSILFDQSVTKTLNDKPNKRDRRTARIRYLHNKSNKRNRNGTVSKIAPYLNNSILNGLTRNGVISNYAKGMAKMPAKPRSIPPSSFSSSSSSSSSSSAASITVAEAASRLALTPFMAELFRRKEEAAAKAAAAKGTT